MARETGIVVDERAEWEAKGAARIRFHCADCDLRGKITGGPIEVVDQLFEAAAEGHATRCEPSRP